MEVEQLRDPTSVPYLRDNIGRLITDCLVDVVHRRPDDPIDFIAKWLYQYANTRLYFQDKEKTARALHEYLDQSRTEMHDRWRRMQILKTRIGMSELQLRSSSLPLTRSVFSMPSTTLGFSYLRSDSFLGTDLEKSLSIREESLSPPRRPGKKDERASGDSTTIRGSKTSRASRASTLSRASTDRRRSIRGSRDEYDHRWSSLGVPPDYYQGKKTSNVAAGVTMLAASLGDELEGFGRTGPKRKLSIQKWRGLKSTLMKGIRTSHAIRDARRPSARVQFYADDRAAAERQRVLEQERQRERERQRKKMQRASVSSGEHERPGKASSSSGNVSSSTESSDESSVSSKTGTRSRISDSSAMSRLQRRDRAAFIKEDRRQYLQKKMQKTRRKSGRQSDSLASEGVSTDREQDLESFKTEKRRSKEGKEKVEEQPVLDTIMSTEGSEEEQSVYSSELESAEETEGRDSASPRKSKKWRPESRKSQEAMRRLKLEAARRKRKKHGQDEELYDGTTSEGDLLMSLTESVLDVEGESGAEYPHTKTAEQRKKKKTSLDKTAYAAKRKKGKATGERFFRESEIPYTPAEESDLSLDEFEDEVVEIGKPMKKAKSRKVHGSLTGKDIKQKRSLVVTRLPFITVVAGADAKASQKLLQRSEITDENLQKEEALDESLEERVDLGKREKGRSIKQEAEWRSFDERESSEKTRTRPSYSRTYSEEMSLLFSDTTIGSSRSSRESSAELIHVSTRGMQREEDGGLKDAGLRETSSEGEDIAIQRSGSFPGGYVRHQSGGRKRQELSAAEHSSEYSVEVELKPKLSKKRRKKLIDEIESDLKPEEITEILSEIEMSGEDLDDDERLEKFKKAQAKRKLEKQKEKAAAAVADKSKRKRLKQMSRGAEEADKDSLPSSEEGSSESPSARLSPTEKTPGQSRPTSAPTSKVSSREKLSRQASSHDKLSRQASSYERLGRQVSSHERPGRKVSSREKMTRGTGVKRARSAEEQKRRRKGSMDSPTSSLRSSIRKSLELKKTRSRTRGRTGESGKVKTEEYKEEKPVKLTLSRSRSKEKEEERDNYGEEEEEMDEEEGASIVLLDDTKKIAPLVGRKRGKPKHRKEKEMQLMRDRARASKGRASTDESKEESVMTTPSASGLASPPRRSTRKARKGKKLRKEVAEADKRSVDWAADTAEQSLVSQSDEEQKEQQREAARKTRRRRKNIKDREEQEEELEVDREILKDLIDLDLEDAEGTTEMDLERVKETKSRKVKGTSPGEKAAEGSTRKKGKKGRASFAVEPQTESQESLKKGSQLGSQESLKKATESRESLSKESGQAPTREEDQFSEVSQEPVESKTDEGDVSRESEELERPKKRKGRKAKLGGSYEESKSVLEKTKKSSPPKVRSRRGLADQPDFAEWGLDRRRLVCRHPRLGNLGELQRIRQEQSVEDWVQHRFSCYVHFDNEVYNNCNVSFDLESFAEFSNHPTGQRKKSPAGSGAERKFSKHKSKSSQKLQK